MSHIIVLSLLSASPSPTEGESADPHTMFLKN